MTIKEFREVKTKRIEELMYNGLNAAHSEHSKMIIRLCLEGAIELIQAKEFGEEPVKVTQ